jgi:hypothetical protein
MAGAYGYRSVMSDEKNLKRGDKVEWSSHGHTVSGTVEKKITEDEDSKEAGRKVKASEDDPQYLVKSDKSGGEAAHKPGALKKT